MSIVVLWLSLALAALAGPAAAEEISLRVIAGDGTIGLRDGTEARFHKPIRLAAFDEDTVVVADIFNHAIRLVRRDGLVTTIAGGNGKGHRDGPADQALFASPHGVAVSSEGVIAVVEAENSTVRLMKPVQAAGDKRPRYDVSTVAGMPGLTGMRDGPGAQALFRSPHAVVWEADRGLLVVDIGNARLRRIRDGIVTTVAGTDAKGSADGLADMGTFVAPMDLAYAPDGSVLIADAGSNRIRQWSAAQGLKTLRNHAPLDRPHGIAADPAGGVWVAEIGAHRVVHIAPDGSVRRIAGTGNAGPGPQELNQPAAVLLHGGLLWIADLGNHRISVLPVKPSAAARR
jgi:DNA-binding beta-propeller fold protein YncE